MPLGLAIGLADLAVVITDPMFTITNIVQRSFVIMQSIPLIAIIFFVSSANILAVTGGMDELINLANVTIGRFKGSLPNISIVASMLFAGVSGSSVADATSIGSVLIPGMKKAGYSAAYSAGINAASSVLSVIIPPSIPMVVFGITANLPIGALFLSGAIPGITYGLLSIVISYYLAVKRNYPQGESYSFSEILNTFKKSILVLIFPIVILVPLIFGWATVTEVSAIGVVYSILFGIIRRKISFSKLFFSFCNAGIMAGAVMFIVAMSNAFAWFLTVYQVPVFIESLIYNITDNPLIILFIMMVVLWISGLFIEFIPAILLFTPIYMRLALSIGISPIHLGAIMIVNLAFGTITPPVGGLLIVSSKIANVQIEKAIITIIPYLILAMGICLLTTFFEPFSMWLPNLIYGL